MAATLQKKFGEDVRRLFPGREVLLEGGLTVTVFPVGLRHIEKFTSFIGKALYEITLTLKPEALTPPGLGAPTTAKSEVSWEAVAILVPRLAETLISDAVDMMKDCCSPDVTDLPHWLVADLMIAWIDESFGEEKKLRPWIRAIEKLIERLTNQKVDLWAKVSNFLSPTGIDSVKSFIRDNLGVPMSDGASPSITTGSSESKSSTASAEPTS